MFENSLTMTNRCLRTYLTHNVGFILTSQPDFLPVHEFKIKLLITHLKYSSPLPDQHIVGPENLFH